MRSRLTVLDQLRRELIGPNPAGEPLAIASPAQVKASSAWGPYVEEGTGQEILCGDEPYDRYGAGVLYPREPVEESVAELDAAVGFVAPLESTEGDPVADGAVASLEAARERLAHDRHQPDDSEMELDLSDTAARFPSTVAISFFADIGSGGSVVVSLRGARYEKFKVVFTAEEGGPDLRKGTAEWWVRRPLWIRAQVPAELVLSSPAGRVEIPDNCITSSGVGGIDLVVGLVTRKGTDGLRLLTAFAENRSKAQGASSVMNIFQTRLGVAATGADGQPLVLPYPSSKRAASDEEELGLDLLYHDRLTYAVGHGCSATWGRVSDSTAEEPRVRTVFSDALPTVEVPATSPDIWLGAGQKLEVSMAALAGIVADDDGMAALERVVGLYEEWIDEQESEALALPTRLQPAAKRNLAACRVAALRMRCGLAVLADDAEARQAFQLANYAILLQQQRLPKTHRAAVVGQGGGVTFPNPYVPVNPRKTIKGKGSWRPFQAAFLLMNLKGISDPDAPDASTVDLIWFPTGGGKTEAYLGLIAFTVVLRRLRGSKTGAVTALMRYTLRLLTAQQFQRAATLFCALEFIRRNHPDGGRLGGEFRIGIWLGSGVTPNRDSEALNRLKTMKRSGPAGGAGFLLNRCPWCGAQMGPIETTDAKKKKGTRWAVLGYSEAAGEVRFSCPDTSCEFSGAPGRMPVEVVDEGVYRRRPDLVIGTVDKFAMLAWEPKARALFGIADNGERDALPPQLIIQDELHLISGPLGSLAGLYEPVVEELCSDGSRRPKIVCSTATIRNFEEQVVALYGRTRSDSVGTRRADAALFPPPALAAGETFFSTRMNQDGQPFQGTMYVGLHAPGLRSIQTAQVRAFSALLQAPMALAPEERDPFWTLMLFYNSLRELGYAITLLQSDIPHYMKAAWRRAGIEGENRRWLHEPMELTSRVANEEITEYMAALEREYPSSGKVDPESRPVDACLASNIIEVGIDIDRLSAMTVVGQPKSTAQYIQVTGRVGRRWWERPGLVLTLYGPQRARDRSHYERFRTYHERLYAEVEPTSVTPFSTPALDRALHAAVIAYVRQKGSMKDITRPSVVPRELLMKACDVLERRGLIVDPLQKEEIARVVAWRMSQWDAWDRDAWSWHPDLSGAPLLTYPGTHRAWAYRTSAWATPTSMRNVDAECQAEVSMRYFYQDEVL